MKNELSFNWDIHWECNYRCPYCWFNGKWEELKKKNVYPPLETLVNGWKNIYKRYGKAKVAITGGEPFTYPRFTEFISEMSQFHQFMVITNLSEDVTGFIAANAGNNVAVNPSFHALYADVSVFIQKALQLKKAGMMQCVTYLAWPPMVPKLPFYQDMFVQHGLSLTVQPFFGEYEGRRYPDSYTGEEKSIIFPQLGTRGDKPFQTDAFNPRGKQCNAGRTYGVIEPDGMARRCGGLNSSDAMIGNIFRDDFRLNPGPLPCTSEICPCNEWAFLLQEEA